MTIRGVDVSSHQGHVDWTAVAADGLAFAFVKATGGTTYTNPYYADQIEGARAAGLVVGSYHYAFESSMDPYPGAGPEAEADAFIASVTSLGIEVGDMLALDVEEGPPGSDVGAWALRFVARVEQLVGFKPVVYTGAWFSDPHGFADHPELSQYGLWLAAYQDEVPDAPAPWRSLAFWQFTADGAVSGVSGPADLNELIDVKAGLAAYGKPAATSVPVYDPVEPAQAQDQSWDCSQQSISWALYSWGRTPDDDWMEQSMMAEGVISAADGCLDRSGAGLAAWVNRHYGEDGYVAESVGDGLITFDDIAAEAATMSHPLAVSGWGWYHWSGVRGYDVENDLLLLANPADGYMGVYQTLSRSDFNRLGPWSLVRVTNPQAEGNVPPPDDLDYSPWLGHIGSGLLDMMREDKVLPAQSASTWLPLGQPGADVEECLAQDGTMYRWTISTTNAGFRYRPS